MEKPVVSGSSKVTVEYTDPSGVFHLIAHDLYQRLPLRNLHWNSSSRPLRSISSLHVELVPDGKVNLQDIPTPSASEGSNQVNKNGSTPYAGYVPRSQAPASEELRKERRHQIPGLRQTPYLKIYLLRCADTESYKATSRKLLRDWVKNHIPPSQNSTSISKQENHDAFEWLILHVVLPGDDASASRLSGNTKSDSRWPTRISSSLVEKIRADFNGTSKSAVDRIAQVRAIESSDGTKVSSRPTPLINQVPGDDHRGWDDVVNKLKFLILASFDLRVSQYEEDIREKDSRRGLPGWNFNTFFVLKEGLARGFESVGLVEDALTGYHELAVGLKAVIDEQRTDGSPEQSTNLFRDRTEEVLEEFRQAALSRGSESRLKYDSNPDSVNSPRPSARQDDFGASILDTHRKPFRELILANNISAFDFQCYVFARQVTLLLRLAHVVTRKHSSAADPDLNGTDADRQSLSAIESIPNDSEPQNLLILSDICRRATEFIASAACALRVELSNSVNFEIQDHNHGTLLESPVDGIVENLCASWTFSVSQSVLKKTSVQSLSDRLQPLLRQTRPNRLGNETSHQISKGFSDIAHRKDLPNRTSSLPPHTPSDNRSSISEKLPSVTSLDAMRLLPPTSSQTGFQELAAQHADLTLLGRRILSSLASRVGGWSSGWTDLSSVLLLSEEAMEEVPLDDTSTGDVPLATNESHDHSLSTVSGVRNKALLSALTTKSAFYEAYEDLTTSALGYYVLSARQKSAEGMVADIAAVRFYLEDCDTAASYFHQLAPFYAKNDWSHLEMSVLEMYAQCLNRQTDRNEEYIKSAFQIIEKVVQRRRTTPLYQPSRYASGHLDKLLFASKSLDQPISVSMDRFFGDIRLDPFLRHHDVHDGFQLILRFRYLMPEGMLASKVRAKIVSVDTEQSNEIWLTADDFGRMELGLVTVLLRSNIMLPAWYTLNQITLQSENIIFTHDLNPSPSWPLLAGDRDATSLKSSQSASQARILVWAQLRALEARLSVSHSRSINLGHVHSLVVDVSSGRNDILEGRIQLRAATAGLRLHNAEAELQNTNTNIIDQSQPGTIRFGKLSADADLKLSIPYSLENDLNEIVVKLEIHYMTKGGSFTYACNPKISIRLPVDVNVQDIFKGEVLFSKFSISTVDSIPLRVSKCSLEGTRDFEVSTPPLADRELDVLTRQPLSFVAQIFSSARSKSAVGKQSELERKLVLQIEYSRINEEILFIIEHSFSTALAGSPFQHLSRLLVPALSSSLKSKILSKDLEMAAVMREIHVGTFLDYSWEALLSGLSLDRSPQLSDWMQRWHKEHLTIQLPDGLREPTTHYLTVPVEIPQMQVVHTAHLRLLNSHTENQIRSSHVTIGHTLPAELTIKHTRQWGSLADSHNASQPLDFCYEIQASPDVWLIGGQRKAHFSAREDEAMRFPIILLPQRTGHLLLPSVDVEPSQPYDHRGADENKLSSALEISSYETDYRNQGESVLVIPNLSSTTVSLDPHGSTNGAWLVESRSRGADETAPASP